MVLCLSTTDRRAQKTKAECSLPWKKWPTKNFWFCLLVTLVGMSVVDCYRIYLNHDTQKYEKMDIVQFADELSLQLWVRQQKKATTLVADPNTLNGQGMRLEKITNHLGEIHRQPMTTQINKHRRAAGNSITANCYICHKYMKKANATNYVQTAFHCSDCKMPVCKTDRSNERRPNSCYLEHKTSKDSIIGWLELSSKRRTFPKERWVLL